MPTDIWGDVNLLLVGLGQEVQTEKPARARRERPAFALGLSRARRRRRRLQEGASTCHIGQGRPRYLKPSDPAGRGRLSVSEEQDDA